MDKTQNERRTTSTKKIAFTLSTLILYGCSSTIQIDDKGRSIIHNFGYTRIILPPKHSSTDSTGNPIEFSSIGIKTVGLQSGENSFSIGYASTALLQIPLDCHMVAVVQNERQLQHLIEILDKMNGEQFCVTVSSD